MQAAAAEQQPQARPTPSVSPTPTVLVAGGGGRLGRRIVRELLQQNAIVRVAARDPAKAERDVQEYLREAGVDSRSGGDASRIVYLSYDATEPASVQYEKLFRDVQVDAVIDAMGTTQFRPWTVYSTEYQARTELIRAASAKQGIKHFILVTSLGTRRWGWPAGALNLFWGILYWKGRAEQFLVDQQRRDAAKKEGGLRQYTIVRPAGLERLQDADARSWAVRLYPPDTQFSGAVPRLQVAQVCVAAMLHPDESRNKVVEVVSEEGGAPRDIVEMLRAL